MARPDTEIKDIGAQQNGWDDTLDQEKEKLRDLLFLKPYPIPVVHKTTPSADSVDISTFPPSDYQFCMVCVVDGPSSTTGHIAYSDGTNWRYVKSDGIV